MNFNAFIFLVLNVVIIYLAFRYGYLIGFRKGVELISEKEEGKRKNEEGKRNFEERKSGWSTH